MPSKVCLRRPYNWDTGTGGEAYCDGNLCFGLGQHGTHNPNSATCADCLKTYGLERSYVCPYPIAPV